MDIKSQIVKDGIRWKVLTGTPLEHAIISFIHKSWGSELMTHFPGPQPISIERKHFPILKKGTYVVCEKSDGERAILLLINLNNKPMCFMINRNNDFYFLDLSFFGTRKT